MIYWEHRRKADQQKGIMMQIDFNFYWFHWIWPFGYVRLKKISQCYQIKNDPI